MNTAQAKLKHAGEVPFVTFPVLEKFSFINHGFSTRLGGVSTGMFSSMNLSRVSGGYEDDWENIKTNYEKICSAMDMDPKSVVVSSQVHKTEIRRVDENDCGKGLYQPKDYREIDGLITNVPGIVLVTKYADCVPLYFVDPVTKSIGLSHSGWRGTVAGMGAVTVREMKDQFGSDPEDIIAVIGPSICQDCYEVSQEVADNFRMVFDPSGNTVDNILLPRKEGKYLLNLWEANRVILSDAGLSPENIIVSGVCTSCNGDLFFSHRKSQGKRGSLAAFLSIRK